MVCEMEACRLCGQLEDQGAKLKCLFPNGENNEDISNLLLNLIGVNIKKEDALPQNVCEVCDLKIQDFYHFIQQCKETDQHFQARKQETASVSATGELNENNSRSVSQILQAKLCKKQSIGGTNIQLKLSNQSVVETENTIVDPVEKNKPVSLPQGTVVLQKQNCCVYILPDGSIYELPISDAEKNSKHLEQGGAHSALKFGMKTSDETRTPVIAVLKRQRGRPKKSLMPQCSAVSQTPMPMKRKRGRPRKNSITHTCASQTLIAAAPVSKKGPLPVLLPKTNIELLKNLQCPECDIYFLTEKDLASHSSEHHNLQHCPICQLPFLTEDLKVKHIRERHPLNICSFEGCPFFSIKPNLVKRHSFLHTLEKSHKCQQCEKTFKTRRYLELHTRRCHTTSTASYPCQICGKKFKWKITLRYHEQYHISGPHHCSMCTKQFQMEDSLRRHIRAIHGGECFRCKVCGRRFGDKHSCISHWKRHFVDKYRVFRCSWPGCKFSDYFKNRLQSHIMRVHEKLVPPTRKQSSLRMCHVCGCQVTSLARHLRKGICDGYVSSEHENEAVRRRAAQRVLQHYASMEDKHGRKFNLEALQSTTISLEELEKTISRLRDRLHQRQKSPQENSTTVEGSDATEVVTEEQWVQDDNVLSQTEDSQTLFVVVNSEDDGDQHVYTLEETVVTDNQQFVEFVETTQVDSEEDNAVLLPDRSRENNVILLPNGSMHYLSESHTTEHS